jgi:hypothetical protein
LARCMRWPGSRISAHSDHRTVSHPHGGSAGPSTVVRHQAILITSGARLELRPAATCWTAARRLAWAVESDGLKHT